MNILLLVLIICSLAFIWNIYGTVYVLNKNAGNITMVNIQKKIRAGAFTFMLLESRTILACMAIVGLVLWAIFSCQIALAFWMGSVVSLSAGFLGMNSATLANARTTQAARSSLKEALNVSFMGGSVMGMAVVGLALCGLTFLFVFFADSFFQEIFMEHKMLLGGEISYIKGILILSAYSAGASLVALFSRVGGGIYTKAADMAADSMGKIAHHIPEDDPRNPATIADNVGDNVGDIAGLGADLFESYIGAAVSSIILGMYLFLGQDNPAIRELLNKFNIHGNFEWIIFLPLLFLAGGILACLVGIIYIRFRKTNGSEDVQELLSGGSMLSALITAGIMAFVSWISPFNWLPFYTAVIGIGSGIVIGLISERYTSSKYHSVRSLAKSYSSGTAVGITKGLATGMMSTLWPCLIMAGTTIWVYQIGGLLGITYAALGMLSFLGMTVAIDSYGPIADNASGIASMAKLPEDVRKRTDKLDSVGNTTAAIGKGFAIASAGYASLGLIAAYVWSSASNIGQIAMPDIPLLNYEVGGLVIAGIIIGSATIYIFSALLINSVARTANLMIMDIKEQFKDPDILLGKKEPDYQRCIKITAHGGVKQMVIPAILSLLMPLTIGFLLGRDALSGVLIGALISGISMALYCANAGGAMDNAKKYIEEGYHGGVGSESHDVAVIADMVGDPLKDTVGPALDVLIKVMCVISLLFASLSSILNMLTN